MFDPPKGADDLSQPSSEPTSLADAGYGDCAIPVNNAAYEPYLALLELSELPSSWTSLDAHIKKLLLAVNRSKTMNATERKDKTAKLLDAREALRKMSLFTP